MIENFENFHNKSHRGEDYQKFKNPGKILNVTEIF
jgi:hypothetical protein